jgi:FG-GAP-like repeat/FG-GAP repeat
LIFPLACIPLSLTAGDFNGDGRIDLAAANSGDNTVSILLGSGNGTFQPQIPHAAGTSPFSVATGDFNGDGKLDLVVATYGAFSVATLQGNGDGTFQAPVNYPVVSPYNPVSVVVADLNGDGIPDLAVASTRSGYTSEDYVSVLLGNGDGTFQNAANYTCVRFVSSIAAADFNGDGKLQAHVLLRSRGQRLGVCPVPLSGSR